MAEQSQRPHSRASANTTPTGAVPQVSQAPLYHPTSCMDLNVQHNRASISSTVNERQGHATEVSQTYGTRFGRLTSQYGQQGHNTAVTASFNRFNHQNLSSSTGNPQGASQTRPASPQVLSGDIQRPILNVQPSISASDVQLPDYGDGTIHIEDDGSICFQKPEELWKYLGNTVAMFSLISSTGTAPSLSTTSNIGDLARSLQRSAGVPQTPSTPAPLDRETYIDNGGHRFLDMVKIRPGMVVNADEVTAWRSLAVARYRDNGRLVPRPNLVDGGTAGALFVGRHYGLIRGINPDGTAQVVWFNTNHGTGLQNKGNEVIKVSLNVKIEGDNNYVKQNARIPDNLTLEVKNNPRTKYRTSPVQVLTTSTTSTIQMATKVAIQSELPEASKAIFKKAMDAYGLYIGTNPSDRGQLDLGEFSFLNLDERIGLEQLDDIGVHIKKEPGSNEDHSTQTSKIQSGVTADEGTSDRELMVLDKFRKNAQAAMSVLDNECARLTELRSALEQERVSITGMPEVAREQTGTHSFRDFLETRLDEVDRKGMNERPVLEVKEKELERARERWTVFDEEYKNAAQNYQPEGQPQPALGSAQGGASNSQSTPFDDALSTAGLTSAKLDQILFGLGVPKRAAEDPLSDTEHHDKRTETSPR